MTLAADIVIRHAQAKDAPALAESAAALFEQTYAGKMPARDLQDYIAQDFTPGQQLAELSDPAIITLLAEYNGALLGYAQVRRKAAPVAIDTSPGVELWRIYLDRSSHGRGIGKRLLAAVAQATRSMSSEHLWLGVWEQNPRAIAFYEKHGFRIVGSQAFEIGNETHNDLVMVGTVEGFGPAEE